MAQPKKDDFFLVQFLEDDIYYICKETKIQQSNKYKVISCGNTYYVKWIDRKFYPAKLISSGTKAELQEIKQANEKQKIQSKIKDFEFMVVQFVSDNVIYICRKTDIKKSNSKTQVTCGEIKLIKWSDGFYYKAKILNIGSKFEMNEKKKALTRNQENIEKSNDSKKLQQLANSHTKFKSESSNPVVNYTSMNKISTDLTCELNEQFLNFKENPKSEVSSYVLAFDNSDDCRIDRINATSNMTKNDNNDINSFVVMDVEPNGNCKDQTDNNITNDNLSLSSDIDEDKISMDDSSKVLSIIDEADSNFDDSDADPDYIFEAEHEIENTVFNETRKGHKSIENNDNDFDESDIDPDIEHEVEKIAEMAQDVEKEVPQPNVRQMESLLEKVNNYPATINQCQINYIQESKSKPKKYFCKYCKQLFSKLVKHLERRHRDEEEVLKFALLPKDSVERQELINAIRKDGAFEFNTNSAYNTGNLILTRRPTNSRNKTCDDYIVCPYCKGFYSKSSIKKHFLLCLPNVDRGNKNVKSYGRRVLGKLHPNACPTLREKFFPVLRDDMVTKIVRFDELAIIFANSLCKKYTSEHHHNMIRARIRYIGRFLIEIKKIAPNINDLASCLSPKNYDHLVNAVNNVAQLNKDGNKYNTPSSAAMLGTLLKKCAKHLIVECIKKDDMKKKADTENLLHVYEQDFSSSVNKTVVENQLEYKRHKNVVLPTTQDIKLLNAYLAKARKNSYLKLKQNFNFSEWKNLLQYTLTSVQIFNRRRAGEIERIYIVDYKSYQSIDECTNRDLFLSLTPESQNAARQYVRFTIRGKLARGVPVLLYKELFHCFELLLAHRKAAGVSEGNPYMFGLPGGGTTYKHLSATILLRKFSSECGASNPETLRGTQLRKHIATQSVLLNLKESEVSDLANFLGHHEKIHRDHYRMPILGRDISNMSRLLEIAQGTCSLSETITSEQEDDECVNENETMLSNVSSNCEMNLSGTKKRSVSPMGKVKRTRWSDEEKITVQDIFSHNLQNATIPSLTDCSEAINQNSQLKNRSPAMLKTWIHNQVKKKNKSI